MKSKEKERKGDYGNKYRKNKQKNQIPTFKRWSKYILTLDEVNIRKCSSFFWKETVGITKGNKNVTLTSAKFFYLK